MYERTGWPAGLLQDDDRKLSRWFAGRSGARRQVDELHNLPELATEGCLTDPARLRPVHGQDGNEHDAGAFVPAAQASTGGDGGGAEGVAGAATQVFRFGGVFHARRQILNGRIVMGIGYTQALAVADLDAQWKMA